MKRREFMALIGGAAATWPLTARAQQFDRVRRIGVLTAYSEHDPEPKSWVTAFQQGLQELGWTEGHNVQIDYRFAGTDPDRIRAHAAEVVRTTPNVILAHSPPVVRALQQATNTIPIVFVQVVDPVELGFVTSLARPGSNITGFTNFEFSVGSKWVGVLKEVAPAVARAIVMLEPNNPAASGFLRAIEAGARRTEMELTLAGVQDAPGVERAMEAFTHETNGGVIILPSPITLAHRARIIALTAAYGLPAIYPFRYFPASGGLMSYGSNASEVFRQAAPYVDRILRGAKPSDLPVQQPSKYELVINLKTAKALGLTVPPSLLARADEVIE